MKESRGRRVSLRPNALFGLALLVLTNNSFAAEPLTLEDCVSLAKEDNLRLIQAQTAVEQARAGVMGAYSSYYPDLDLSSSYRYGEEQIGEGSYSTGVDARYTLYKGGYIRASTKIARARVEIAQENYRLTESEVILAVKEALFEILQKQEQIALAQNILDRRKEDLVLIRLRYDVGRESSPAVKEAEAALLQAEHDKTEAAEELSLAKTELNLLLGRPRKQELSVVYSEQDIEFPPLEKMIEEAKTERPEIVAEQANREVLDAQVAQAKSNYWPTLSLSSSYGLRGNEFLDQHTDWNVGVSLSLPIFDGFSTKAKVKEATLSLKEEDTKIQQIEQTIEEELEQVWVDRQLATKNLEVTAKTLEAAREMYELTRLQYEQGLTSYFFLQQKENALTRAEYDQVNADLKFRITTAKLQKVRGRQED